jgi:hypothetical protein
MKVVKGLKWVALGIVGVLLVGTVVGYLVFNSVLRSTIQTQSQQNLNLPVTLAGAKFSLFGGNLTLNDYVVGNAPGFDAPQMLSLGQGSVTVGYGDLMAQPVRIESVTLRQPKLVIEQKGTKINFQALTQGGAGGGTPTPAPGPGPTPSPADKEPLRLIINQLAVQDAVVEVRPNIPGLSTEPIVLNIPSFTLNKIGTGDGNQNGVEVKRLVTMIVMKMAESASDNEKLPPQLRQILALAQDPSKLEGVLRQQLEGRVNEALDRAKDKLPPGVRENIPGDLGGLLNQIPGDKKKRDEKK